MSTKNRPSWHYDVPQERQGHWVATDSKWRISDGAGYAERVRVVLHDGTVIDGIMREERHRWDATHAFAVSDIPGRKSRRWVARRDVAEIWGDKGRPLEELLTAVLQLRY
jgi:hypothetical protein